jgi:hypothetical protein
MERFHGMNHKEHLNLNRIRVIEEPETKTTTQNINLFETYAI